MAATATKSYALVGDADNVRTLENDQFENEVEDQWFSATVPRKQMKALMRRSNREAAIHFGTWGVLLIGSGVCAVLTWGNLVDRSVPSLLRRDVLDVGSSSP